MYICNLYSDKIQFLGNPIDLHANIAMKFSYDKPRKTLIALLCNQDYTFFTYCICFHCLTLLIQDFILIQAGKRLFDPLYNENFGGRNYYE